MFCKLQVRKKEKIYTSCLHFASLRSNTSSMQVWSQTLVFLYTSIFYSDKTCAINFTLSYRTIVFDIIFITIPCIWLLFTRLWSSKVSNSIKTCILLHITKIKLIFMVDQCSCVVFFLNFLARCIKISHIKATNVDSVSYM